MGVTRNLTDREATAKIREIAGGQVAMLCTFTADGTMTTRPMATAAVDDDGTLWFLSRRNSDKNVQIAANPTVRLLYTVHDRAEYLALDGDAYVVRDQRTIDDVWTPFANAWFPRGKDDPELTLIRVTPTTGFYWDTEHGRMVALVKLAIGAVTGRPTDDAVVGTLDP